MDMKNYIDKKLQIHNKIEIKMENINNLFKIWMKNSLSMMLK